MLVLWLEEVIEGRGEEEGCGSGDVEIEQWVTLTGCTVSGNEAACTSPP